MPAGRKGLRSVTGGSGQNTSLIRRIPATAPTKAAPSNDAGRITERDDGPRETNDTLPVLSEWMLPSGAARVRAAKQAAAPATFVFSYPGGSSGPMVDPPGQTRSDRGSSSMDQARSGSILFAAAAVYSDECAPSSFLETPFWLSNSRRIADLGLEPLALLCMD
jgi:hypothetical protein